MVDNDPKRLYDGLKDDPKPMGDDIENGASFLEMDTGKVFKFDKEHKAWLEL